jgi:archaellum biogenesis ATPase FlaH
MENQISKYGLPRETSNEYKIAAHLLMEPKTISILTADAMNAEMFTDPKTKAVYQIASTFYTTTGRGPMPAEIQMKLDKNQSDLTLDDLVAIQRNFNEQDDVHVLGQYVKAAYIKTQLAVSFNRALQISSDPTTTIEDAMQYALNRINEYSGLMKSKADDIKNVQKFMYDTSNDVEEPRWMFEVFGANTIPERSLVAVTGKAKAGKSNFIMLMMSAILKTNESFSGLKCIYPMNNVLYIDTEQPHSALNMKFRRMLRTAHLDEHTPLQSLGIHLLSMRDASIQVRHDTLMRAYEMYRPQFVIIDGIVDICKDFNSIEEAQNLISELMALTSRGCSVVALLHENEGATTKMRGHLGTILLQKCDDKFAVAKKDGYFEVSHQGRNTELDKIQFRIDGNVYVSGAKGSMDDDKAEAIKEIYRNADKEILPWADVEKALADKFGVKGHSTASRWIKTYIHGENALMAYDSKTKSLKLISPPI